MNRFTVPILLVALLPGVLPAQFFPTDLHKSTLPAQHAKGSGPSALAPAVPFTLPAGTGMNEPVCGADGMHLSMAETDPVLSKELARHLEELVPLLSGQGPADKSSEPPLITISVTVHVIHNGVPVGQGQNLSDAQILAQLAILNEDFAALNSQYYQTPGMWQGVAGIPNIEFCLASTDPFGQPTTGITRHQLQVTGTAWNSNNINSVIKPITKWDPSRYMNIYVLPIPGTTSAGGVVGFANYPTPSLIGSSQDGIVIDYRWFGAPGFGVSGWRALTHETGHYLGIPHPFNGNSCTADDGIADTPNINKATSEYANLDCSSGYPSGPVSCGNEHLYVNYMDYVNENCYTSFTQGQANVMRAILNGSAVPGFNYGSRNALVQNAPLQCNLPAHDLGVTRLLTPPPVTCTTDSLHPMLTIRNFGSETVTQATLSYRIGQGVPVVANWSGQLAPGQLDTVVLAPFLPPAGPYALTIYTGMPNGTADERPANDTLVRNGIQYLPFSPPLYEDFEATSELPSAQEIYQLNLSNDDFVWEVDPSVSAFGTGSGSVFFDNYAGTSSNNPYGTIDALITRHYDLSAAVGAQLRFDVAYAPIDALLSDTLVILVATACSQDFNQLVFRKGGTQLSTAPPTAAVFIPQSDQWRTEVLDLSDYDGVSDLTIAFVNVSGWGNRLYLDNIRLGNDCEAITYDLSLTPNSCEPPPGTCDGMAAIELSQHNGDLRYAWAGLPTSYNLPYLEGLCPDEPVSVTVTDGFGCAVTASATISQAVPGAINGSSMPESTFGGMNGSAAVSVSNGSAPFDFQWSNGFQETASMDSASVQTGLAPGVYGVTVTDRFGCASEISISVASACGGFSAQAAVGPVSCFGAADGTATVTPEGGLSPWSFEWSNGMTGATVGGLAAGSYTVSVTDDAGCPLTVDVLVPEPTQLTAAAVSTAVSSAGGQDGTASATATGGTPPYHFQWSNGETGPALTGLQAGDYTVTVTDENGCVALDVVTVAEVSCTSFQPVLSIVDVSCFGAADGAASVSLPGGDNPSYTWGNGATTASVGGLPAGTVQVTVVDASGCTATLMGLVTEPAPLGATANTTDETAPGANNGTLSVFVTGGTAGYTFAWSNGFNQSAAFNLIPGQYIITVTDANGCSVVTQGTVEAFNCSLSAALDSSPASCPDVADGLAVVSSIAGGAWPFDYEWSNGDDNFFTGDLLPGSYVVTITDAIGCSVVASVEVVPEDVVPPGAFAQNISLSLDANGELFLTPDLVDNGSFDNCSLVALEVTPDHFTCADLGFNLVTLKATDSSGNSSSATAFVQVTDQEPPVLQCPADTLVQTCDTLFYTLPTAVDACSEVTLTLLSGPPSGTLFPAGETPVSWLATDAFGNSAACQFTITVDYGLDAGITVQAPTCAGDADGALIANPTGGEAPYTVTWGGGIDPTALSAGIYFVTVADAAGCSISEAVSLTDPPLLLFGLISITPATPGFADGIIEYVVMGGAPPYQLNWQDSNGEELADFDSAALAPGAYRVLVTDSLGCTYLSNYFIVDQVSATADPGTGAGISVRLYPNPARSEVWLEIAGFRGVEAEVTLFDPTGRPLVRQPWPVDGAPHRWPVTEDLPGGSYWVRVSFADGAPVWHRLQVIK